VAGLVWWFALGCMLLGRGFVCEHHSCFRSSSIPTGFVFCRFYSEHACGVCGYD